VILIFSVLPSEAVEVRNTIGLESALPSPQTIEPRVQAFETAPPKPEPNPSIAVPEGFPEVERSLTALNTDVPLGRISINPVKFPLLGCIFNECVVSTLLGYLIIGSNPVKARSPFISNFAPGFVVPIPTLPELLL